MTTMTTSARRPAPAAEPGMLRLGAGLMAAAGLAFIGYAAIFFIRNFTGAFLELGIGHDQVNVDRTQIREFSPQLSNYISHLHIALAGFIAATGLATAALAWFGVRRGELWAYVTAIAAPVLALVVALPAHYPYGLATLGHLGLVYLAIVVFVVGALLALKPIMQQRRATQR